VVIANNNFSNGQLITFGLVPGMIQLSHKTYYIGNVTTVSFALYFDLEFMEPVDGTNFSPFIVNSFDGNGNPYSGTRYVPLVFDPISGTYCAPLSKVNQEERLQALEVTRRTYEDMSFLYRAGFVNGPNQPVNVI